MDEIHKAKEFESFVFLADDGRASGFFSIIQRNILTPNDFNSLEMLVVRLHRFD